MPDPFVQWKAPYTSHDLNRKFANVIPRGVHRGFWVSVAGADTVDVSASRPDGGTDPANVALVDRDGYQITVREETATTLTVPSTDGLYHVVIEAEYAIGQTTTAQVKIVADGGEASHHVICGSVERASGTLTGLPEEHRMNPVYPLSSSGAIKTANESADGVSTPQADDHLGPVDVRGGTGYIFRAALLCTSSRPLSQGSGGTIKVRWAATGGVSLTWGYTSLADTLENETQKTIHVGLDEVHDTDVEIPFGADNVSGHPAIIVVHGIIETTQAGSIALEWANGDSYALTVHKGSYLRLVDVTS